MDNYALLEEMYNQMIMQEFEMLSESAAREYQEKAEKEYLASLGCPEPVVDEDAEFDVDFPVKNHKRGERRRKDEMKARRKEHLAKEIYSGGFHAPHGYYRKGKIHCSCPMCSAKTNSSLNKSRGPVSPVRNSRRLAMTNKRYGKKSYKPSDIKKVDALLGRLKDFCLDPYFDVMEWFYDETNEWDYQKILDNFAIADIHDHIEAANAIKNLKDSSIVFI